MIALIVDTTALQLHCKKTFSLLFYVFDATAHQSPWEPEVYKLIGLIAVVAVESIPVTTVTTESSTELCSPSHQLAELVWQPGGDLVALAGQEKVETLSARTGIVVGRRSGQPGGVVTSLCWGEQGDQLYCGTEAGAVERLDCGPGGQLEGGLEISVPGYYFQLDHVTPKWTINGSVINIIFIQAVF